MRVLGRGIEVTLVVPSPPRGVHSAACEVHRYFSPHGSPYDAFVSFMNVLTDLERRCGGPAGGRLGVGEMAVTA